MKKVISFFVLSILIMNVSLAQPFGCAAKGFRTKKIYYENSSGEKAWTYFKYKPSGQLSTAFWTLEDGSRGSKNYFVYDEQGNILSVFRDFSDGLSSFERFTYNTSGDKLAEWFFRSDSVHGSATYEYTNGRLTQANLNNHKGWINGILQYSYDKNNLKTSAVLWRGKTKIASISYVYSEGNLSEEIWDFGGKWGQHFYYSYEKIPTSNNKYSSPFLANIGDALIAKEEYTFNGDVGGPSLYYYNANGLLTKKVFIRSDSLLTTTFYKYDDAKRLSTSTRHYSNGDSAVFTYQYDKNQHLIQRLFHKNDSLIGFESYRYNNEGELVEAYLKNFDEWLSGRLVFESNELGLPVRATFKGENGFDAKLKFQYNQSGLLSGYVWEFSFGKYQEYRFEYAPQ